ncbi:MAG TPA: carbohydrate ABC transporter permease [Clostridiaceae bacterium]|nr:carbohydrate ABC transporter permease [Clostridiaceae bacterium]
MKRSKILNNKSNLVYNIVAYSSIILFSVFCLLPFWLMVAGAFTDESAIIQNGYQLIPKKFSLDAFDTIFAGNRVLNAYKVTVLVTIMGTTLAMILTSMMAYGLSLKTIKYRNQISFYVVFTMLFSGGLVPWYILITQYLKLQDTIWVLFVPYLINPWYMFLLRKFFTTIPESLIESAKIDGANDFYIFVKIALPLSLPALATIGLFYSLFFWNDWWLGLLFVNDRRLQPLQLLLRALVSNLSSEVQALNPNSKQGIIPPAYSVRMATSIITIGPIVLFYPFVQKYFVKGLTVGAVKG